MGSTNSIWNVFGPPSQWITPLQFASRKKPALNQRVCCANTRCAMAPAGTLRLWVPYVVNGWKKSAQERGPYSRIRRFEHDVAACEMLSRRLTQIRKALALLRDPVFRKGL